MELLERHFDIAFDAPDGIKKLRELILTLAMQGKLIPQNPNDRPASELLTEIEGELKRLVKEGKIKEPKPLPPVNPKGMPYALPKGWVWVRLGNVGSTNIGLTYSPADVSDSGIPVLRSNNIQSGMLDLSDLKRVAVEVKQSVLVQEGDLLICARNGSRALVGKTAMIPALPEAMAFGAFMAIFRSKINPFLLRFINSPLFREMIDEVNTVTINQITQDNLRSTAFPLPPLSEQSRIVAKIDELMARCDALEKLRAEREAKRLAVHTSAVRQLLNVADSDGHIQAREFLGQHFGELYTVKENVTELRKVILQLAVMGKLAPQDPTDPSASDLLKQIEAEKKRLVKEGRIKAPKQQTPLPQSEGLYLLPSGWVWTRLSDVLDVRDGTHDTPKYVEVGYPLVTSKNISSGTLNLDDVLYISEEDHRKISERSRVDRGDILFAMIGSIGNPVIVDCVDEFSIKNMALFKYYQLGKPDNNYLHYYLVHAQEEMKARSSGAVQSFVSLGFLRNYPFPMPPLAEQRRIVVKINQLMSLCDALEQKIDAARETQSAMLNAMMAQYGGQRCA